MKYMTKMVKRNIEIVDLIFFYITDEFSFVFNFIIWESKEIQILAFFLK